MEYARKYVYTVTDYEGVISKYLQSRYGYSSRVIKSVKKEGELLLNGKHTPFVDRCSSGDTLEVLLKKEHMDSEPQDLPLRILYEDEDILVVDKPPYMVTHPTKSHPDSTLANAVYGYYERCGIDGKLHFVSRLDMDTSGAVIIARNKFIHHLMQNMDEFRPFDKYYEAIIKGHLPESRGVIDVPIMRSQEGIRRIIDDEGKECLTEYEVLETFSEHSLVRLKLLTGRTHQIRVHMQSMGTPILSDVLYGDGTDPLIGRQALHACSVSFMHPVERKVMHFEAELPEDMKKVLDFLEK